MSKMIEKIKVLSDLGWSNSRISEELGISLRSIAAYKANITRSDGDINPSRKVVEARSTVFALPIVARKAYSRAKQRARKLSIQCLTFDEFVAMWEEQNGVCALSGIEFSEEKVRQDAKILSRPWAPSIDRIDSRGDYSRANVRIVTQIVNFSLGEWPMSVFLEMCTAVTINYKKI